MAKVVKDSIVCGLARSGNMDIDSAAEALKPAERKRIHTFISTSPLHMEKKLQMTPEEVHQAVIDSVTGLAVMWKMLSGLVRTVLALIMTLSVC